MEPCAWELTRPSGLHSASACPELAACCCRYSGALAQGYSLEMTPANSIMLLPGGGRSPAISSHSGSLPLTAATCASAYKRPLAAKLVDNARRTFCCKLSSGSPYFQSQRQIEAVGIADGVRKPGAPNLGAGTADTQECRQVLWTPAVLCVGIKGLTGCWRHPVPRNCLLPLRHLSATARVVAHRAGHMLPQVLCSRCPAGEVEPRCDVRRQCLAAGGRWSGPLLLGDTPTSAARDWGLHGCTCLCGG